jgi:hypothetical protein
VECASEQTCQLGTRCKHTSWYFLKAGQEERRTAAELDNPDSPYFTLKLEPLEEAVLRDCLVDQSMRPPMSVLMSRHSKYFSLSRW